MVRTKLREMVKTKSARLVYMLVRKSWHMSVVISGPFSVECRVLQRVPRQRVPRWRD